MAVICNISRVSEIIDSYWHKCTNFALESYGSGRTIDNDGPDPGRGEEEEEEGLYVNE
jgi:hypothetical protein